MKNISGASIIELLIAVFMVSAAVAMLSLLFPKTSDSILNGRQTQMAAALATSKIAAIKSQSYSSISVTTATVTYFPNGKQVAKPGCDCAHDVDFVNNPMPHPDPLNPGLMPAFEIIPSTGTSYTRQTCINFVTFAVGGIATPHCPGLAVEPASKYIRVHVSWTSGTRTQSIDQESVVSRY